jgi:TATA-box binding protein (TBP) (component of TFIID and TFIIIB)
MYLYMPNKTETLYMHMACEKTVPSPAIQNVVSTFDTGQRFDLSAMAMQCCFVQYQPKKFAAAVIRLSDPQTTCLLFESGKSVCTGAGSEQLSCTACLRFVLLLQTNGFPDACFRDFTVQNIVAAVYCPFQLDLFQLADSVSGFCSYEPTLFPGLVYRIRLDSVPSEYANNSPEYAIAKSITEYAIVSGGEGITGKKTNRNKRSRRSAAGSGAGSDAGGGDEIVFVCFQSGKCIITGAKKRENIIDVWSKFYTNVLMSFVASSDTGSSARCNIFDTATKTSYEDDTFGIINSITGSASHVLQSLASTKSTLGNTDRLCFFDRLNKACLHVDILELQGVDVTQFTPDIHDKSGVDATQFTPDILDVAAIELVLDVRSANSLPFEMWILPELQHVKQLRQHVLSLGLQASATSFVAHNSAFVPHHSSRTI